MRETKERFLVDNAGLVLLSPFLPLFFARLDLLDSDREPDGGAQSITDPPRAVHLLNHLADRRLDRPDPALRLPKLLCGVAFDQAVDATIAADAADLALCDAVLNAAITNWRVIGNTTPDGLRDSFLQRAGQLTRVEGGWQLRVTRGPLDLLVDKLPWSISVIRHRWMREPLFVSW